MNVEDKELYSDWFCVVGIGNGKGYFCDNSGYFKWMSKGKAKYIANKLNNREDKILKFI